MEFSIYQKKILKYFRENPSSNMYINAKAGSGKSFIATQMLKDVQDRSLYVAFNKSIATEMQGKINNPKVKVSTIHALCLGVLNYNIEKENEKSLIKTKGTLDNFKIHKIVEELCNKENNKKYNFEYKEFLKENYVELYKLVRLKYLDLQEPYIDKTIKDIVNDYSLFNHEEFHCPYAELENYLKKIDNLSLTAFEENKIYDFTDMLYITLKKLQNQIWSMPGWNYYTNIVADESQDLSTIQIILLKYFKKKNGRYVFLLDPKQAIYSFAGANCYSYRMIQKVYAPIEEFELPINYRCATSHLKKVNDLYKIGIIPREDAPEGKVIEISKEDALDKIEAGDYLIGRKNKWLMPMIIGLVKKGKPVYIKDAALVENIKNTVNKTKALTVNDLLTKIKTKENKLKQKIENTKTNEEDKEQDIKNNGLLETYNIIKILIKAYKEGHTNMRIDIFNNYINKILNTEYSKDCIFVTSIHCVKGLEAKNCFVLNKGEPTIDGYMNADQRQQELNLSYVALTRAQELLYLVSPDGEEY